MKDILDRANLAQMNDKELKGIDGGIIGIICGCVLAYMAIGATVCWNMGVDNRE